MSTSPGRSGFGPELALAYNSGSGNEPFGFGWSMPLPSVTRKTDKGLPCYRDDVESDTFLLSGAEDLTPALIRAADGSWARNVTPSRTVYHNDYAIHRYRARVEGLFARIERWVNLADPADTCWRSISKDNVVSWYGRTADSRIADPANPARIYSWLLCESHDDKGNVVSYEYKPEDSTGVDLTQPCERNRTDAGRSANRYLKRIHYGNRTPYLPDLTADEPAPLPDDWCFEVVLDYGDHDWDNPVPQDQGTGHRWTSRADPFSTCRPTFEVRTYRLCRRVLMFHSFPDADFQDAADVGADCLVRSADLTHATMSLADDPARPFYSYLREVAQTGYRRAEHGGYLRESLPPVQFEYTEASVDETVRDIEPDSLRNLPDGLDGASYRWVDLDGEGLSGVLTERAGGWFYKANLSPANLGAATAAEPEPRATPRFAPVTQVASQPATAALNQGVQQLFSVSGDGRLDLVDFAGPTPGYYERTEDPGWAPFTAFASLPALDWGDPQLRFIDVTGDGFPDLLITDGDALRWHPSLSTRGFGPERRVPGALDEESGPRLVFADPAESVFTADMTGDGLTDVVRIRAGEACYWPNLGYGRFGAKVTMGNTPSFDHPDIFDARRIQLADIDGSGTADIVYFGGNVIRLYFNQSGNAWGAPRDLRHFPSADSASRATALDLLGNGTACLLWSSPLPGNARRQLRYIDLMGGRKPHLLVAQVNNQGTRTVLRYAPATKFYVQDKLAGVPWVTRLPFPVHVVERVETYDYVGRNVFATRYAYHHGYYDGVEREFRGFGRVDQWDTEQYATLAAAPGMPDPVNLDTASAMPPVLTKTWLHTGAYFGAGTVSSQMRHEYWSGDDRAADLPDTNLPGDVMLPDGSRAAHAFSPEELREACRALRGSVLRQEVYALDESPAAPRPYTVSERNYTIEALQPQGPSQYAAFFTHPRETIDYHYERRRYLVTDAAIASQAGSSETVPADSPGAVLAADPRVSHTLTLVVDPYGNVMESAAVSYGRRFRDPALTAADHEVQTTPLASCLLSDYTDAVDSADAYRTPLAARSRTFELIQVKPEAADVFGFAELAGILAVLAGGQHDTPYENAAHAGLTPGQAYRRLVAEERTYYRPDDLGAAAGAPRALLPLGTMESLALPGVAYQLAFTPGLIGAVYQRGGAALLSDPAGVLGSAAEDGGGYADLDGDGRWWAPGGRMYHVPGEPAVPQELNQARQHFFLPRRLEDPFGKPSSVDYDDADLLVAATTDAAGNVTSAVSDYRVLAPALVTDANRNQTAVSFTTLGLVTATAVMGKPGQNLGDTLAGFAADVAQTDIDALYDTADLAALAASLLGDATTRIVYDLHGFSASMAAAPDAPDSWRPPFAATIARETHVSDLARGPDGAVRASALRVGFTYSDGLGREVQHKVQAEPGPVMDDGPVVTRRWVGTGWTIFNNKGKPVRQYEPFFSWRLAGQQFEFAALAGVSPVICYDPPGRVVATIHPDHTYEKAVFDPWCLWSWDADDTVALDNPATDPDVGGYFARLPASDYLPTWHAAYSGGDQWQQQAAAKSAAHADTPAASYCDPLGRAFATVADNGPAGKYFSRLTLDIQGAQRAASDPLGRVVARHEYSMTRQLISQASMEAGQRWTLADVTGQAIRGWDSRGHDLRTTYDQARRVTGRYVQGTDPANSDSRTLGGEVRYEQVSYGEDQPNDRQLNLRARVFQHYDMAGLVSSVVTDPATGQPAAYDFKGNPLGASRRFVRAAGSLPDWSQPPPGYLPDVFVTLTAYDALNRVTAATAPDGSVTRPAYNEAGLLAGLTANLHGDIAATTFVKRVGYNARRQRVLIDYGDAAVTTAYGYDTRTFRLTSLTTTRNGFPAAERDVQALSYTYEAAANITHIHDSADIQNVVFFRNRRVEPSADFSYDAIYRLVTASGREHLGLVGPAPSPPTATSYNDSPRAGLVHPGDGKAMGTYTEQYAYDQAGNFVSLAHQGTDPASPGWSRSYAYNEASLLDAGQVSNRLSATQVHGSQPLTEPYAHDPHGNMTAMPQLQQLRWDFADQLAMTSRRPVSGSDEAGRKHQGEQTHYVYNSAGERVRKTTFSLVGDKLHETLYLGGYEVYRRYAPAGNVTLERQTLHVMDDKQRVALVETTTVNDKASPAALPQTAIRYQFGNHLGTACLELDETGAVITYEEYYPYGGTSYQAGGSALEVSQKRYRYTGKERDKESGLYYHGARYYAPWLARWTSCDPAGLVDGLSLFCYCQDNPVSNMDRNGAQSEASDIPSRVQQKSAFPRDVDQIAKGPLGQTFRANPFSLAGAKALLEGAYEIYKGEPQTPEGRPLTVSESARMFERNTSLAIAYAAGLGQETAKALVGDDVPGGVVGAVGREWKVDALAVAGPMLRVFGAAKQLIGPLGSEAKMARAIVQLNEESVKIQKLTPVKELSSVMHVDSYVTTAKELTGKRLSEVGGRLDVLEPGKLAPRYLSDPIGDVLVEAQTTYGNLKIPEPKLGDVPDWRSSMPSMPGLTGATKYPPVEEFQLVDPVVVMDQPTKPVLR